MYKRLVQLVFLYQVFNMGLYTTVILLAIAFFCQNKLVEARACTGRSTVIQVRVPQKTNVTIKYPSQIDPVKFVPRPTEPDPQCFHCKNSKCQKCNQFNPNARTLPNRRPTSRTNIVIDLKGNHPKKVNENKDIYDTLVYIGDKNSASSVSNSKAKSTGGAAASTSAAATTSNTALIAAFSENTNNGSSPGNTENVYVEDTSQSSAKSSASALAGKEEAEKQPLSEPKTVADGEQSSNQQSAPGQQLVPEKQPAPKEQSALEQKPAPGQPPKQPTEGEKPAQQLTEEKTTLEKEKQPEPTPKAGDDKEAEKSSVTDKQPDIKLDATPSNPTETGKPAEDETKLIPEAKKTEDNPPAAEAAST